MLIRELHIESADLNGTLEFYQVRLGLPVVSKNATQVCILIGSSLLYVHLKKESTAQYHIAFNIPCNKIREANEWLKGKADPLIIYNDSSIVDFRNWNAESVYFMDNNGNVLECIARRDLKNDIQHEFDHSCFLSISEVGIVTENVEATCNSLIRQFGLHYFDKQPPLKNFAAIGDDYGLLIISSSGRNWYPTSIPSKAYWQDIYMDINDKSYILSSSEI